LKYFCELQNKPRQGRLVAQLILLTQANDLISSPVNLNTPRARVNDPHGRRTRREPVVYFFGHVGCQVVERDHFDGQVGRAVKKASPTARRNAVRLDKSYVRSTCRVGFALNDKTGFGGVDLAEMALLHKVAD